MEHSIASGARLPPNVSSHWSLGPLRFRKNRGFLGSDSGGLSWNEVEDRQQLRSEIDLNSWNFRLWAVAASGFLTGSYNLFATNVVYSSIAFVYFPDDRWPSLLLNGCTLLGSVVGQVIFGFLADLFGRTRLYGIELIIVIISTLGLAFSGPGYKSMSFLATFTCWRFLTGIGLGAECDLSAVITSEWSPTSARCSMVAAVFLMQPIGQALAQAVNVAVLLGRDTSHSLQAMRCGLDTKYEYECRQSIDGIWRIVIGVGAVPALLAILFRFMLPDSGLFNLEVRRKSELALHNVAKVYGNSGPQMDARSIPLDPVPSEPEPDTPIQFSRADMYSYFIKERNWLYLLGTSSTWFVLDVALCGFGLDNRVVLADMWATKHEVKVDSNLTCWHSSLPGGNSTAPNWTDALPVWQTDYTEPCNTIYDVLLTQAKHYFLTVSIGSILGCAAFIFVAKYFPRRQFLTASFVSLAILFSATGGVYYGVHHGPYAISTAVMVGICHFAFNFGANSLTFLIPAEIFPTTYRCFCHGISAAAGKLGSIVAVFMVYSINNEYQAITKQGLVFLLFAGIGAMGAIFSWAYLPDIQRCGPDGQLASRTLEELGEGLMRAEAEGQVFTVREKWEMMQIKWKGLRG